MFISIVVVTVGVRPLGFEARILPTRHSQAVAFGSVELVRIEVATAGTTEAAFVVAAFEVAAFEVAGGVAASEVAGGVGCTHLGLCG